MKLVGTIGGIKVYEDPECPPGAVYGISGEWFLGDVQLSTPAYSLQDVADFLDGLHMDTDND